MSVNMYMAYKRLLIFLSIALRLSLASGYSQQDCIKDTEPVVLYPDAPVHIAVLLDLRQFSKIRDDENDGMPKREEVEYFEALKHAIGLVNQKSGEISSRIVRDSFVPGITIGLRVFDTCNDADVTKAFLASLVQAEDSRLIAILDERGIVSANQEISQIAARKGVPVLPILYEEVISTHDLGEAIFRFLRELGWDRLSAVEKYPSKLLSYLTGKSSLCFEKLISENSCFRSESPFLLLATDVCDLFPEGSVAVQSGSVSENEVRELKTRGVERIFVVSLFPKEVSMFEAQWSKRKRVHLVSNPENKWTLEYFMKEKKCRLAGFKTEMSELKHFEECNSLYFAESDIAKISRKERVAASFNAVNTIAYGLRRAWEAKCHNVAGYCSDLESVTPKDFNEVFLKRLEFYNDGPGTRTPAGITGGKMRTSPVGELKGAKFVLMEYKIEGQKLIAEQIFLKDDSGLKKLTPQFTSPPFKCSGDLCAACQRGVRSVPIPVASTLPQPAEDLTVAGTEPDKAEELTSSIPETGEDGTLTIVIPALLPVHHSGPSALQCGTVINQEAIYGVEALLWALDQINRQEHILPGIELGTIVLDTCSSSVKTTRILSGLLAKSDDSSLEELGLKSGQIVAAVVALRGQDARIASDLLSQENVTSVNALSQAIARENSNKYTVEIDVSYAKLAMALVKLLKKMSIMQISVIYSVGDEELSFGFRQLRLLCDSHDIRITNVEAVTADVRMEEVVERLEERDQSSRWGQHSEQPQVLVTLLTEVDADDFMASLVEVDGINNKLFLVGIGNYWEKFSKDPDFSKAVSGAAFLTSDWNPVQDFVQHFRKLKPTENDRNPWFYEYWEQNVEKHSCPEDSQEGNCAHSKIHDSFIDVATVGARMIQSIFLLASSLVRVQKEACHGNKRMEDCSVERFYDRQLLNEFVRKTGTDRVDTNGTDFRLTSEGFGDIPVAVWNIQKMAPQDDGARSSVIMKKVGIFDSKLKLDNTVVTYDQRGQELPLSNLFGKVQTTTTPAPTSTSTRRKISVITRTRPQTTTEETTVVTTEGVETTTIERTKETVLPVTTTTIVPTTTVDCLKDPDCLIKMQSFSPTVKILQVSQEEMDYNLVAVIPIQDKGQDIFTCGQMSDPKNFLLAAAFTYAIKQVSQTRKTPQMNGLVLDYCNSTERAHERVFSILSGDLKSRNYVKVAPQSIIGAIFLDSDVYKTAASMLSEEHVPSVVLSANERLNFFPSVELEMAAYRDVFLEFGWSAITVFSTNSDIGIRKYEILKDLLKSTTVCIVDSFLIDTKSSKETILRSLYIDEAALRQVTIAVMLLDNDEQYDIIQAALQISKHSEDYITVADKSISNEHTKKLITIGLEERKLNGFTEFLNSMKLENHQPMPTEWFEQFYQHHHSCRLLSSTKVITAYDNICNNREFVNIDNDTTYGMINYVVQLFAKKLSEFLEDCPERSRTRNLATCGRDAKESFEEFFRQEMAEMQPEFGFEISITGFSKPKKTKVGTFKNGRLELTKLSELSFKFLGVKCESEYCESKCKSVLISNATSLSSMAGEFRSDFGVAASTVSIIGILLTFVLTGHLFARFSTNEGTTVLDYFILIGVTLLFLSNILHLFTVMVGTCILRRLTCDLGYALIFSGFLVKVLTACKTKGDPPLFENSNTEVSIVKLSSSAIGLTCVQLILTVSWLLVMPPKITLFDNAVHCTPMEAFEAELGISLTYIIILLVAITILSAMLLHRGLEDVEMKWILTVNAICVLVLVVWWVTATQLNYFFRVSTAIICNMVICLVVLMYVILKILSQEKKKEMSFEQSNNSTSSAFASADDIYYEAKNIISSDTNNTLSPEELGLTSVKRYNPLFPDNAKEFENAEDMLADTISGLPNPSQMYEHLKKVHEARGQDKDSHELRESCWITPESTLRRAPSVVKRNKSIREKTEVPNPVFPRESSKSPPPLPDRNATARSRTYSRNTYDNQELPNEIPEVYPETGSWRRHFPTLHSRRHKRPPMPVPLPAPREAIYPRATRESASLTTPTESVPSATQLEPASLPTPREPVFPPGPQVRMVGDRHILLLGDETLSRHGRVSKI